MAKLAGNAHVYHGGSVYAPGDELPDELRHLGDEEEAADEPATSGGTGDPAGATRDEVNGVPINAEFDAEKATVPQLREELKRLGVEFAEGDRKDALQAKYREAVAAS